MKCLPLFSIAMLCCSAVSQGAGGGDLPDRIGEGFRLPLAIDVIGNTASDFSDAGEGIQGVAEEGGLEPRHHEGLHFSHPLIAESPSPDTKVRLDYFFSHDNEADEDTIRAELEYAFARWGSIELNLPYAFVDSDEGAGTSGVGNIDVGLKLACYCFEEYGVLLGGGIELVLPTGDDNKGIGSNNELEVEPFIDVGFKIDRFEIVGFLAFGIPTNESEDEKDGVDLELGYNLSLMYHLADQLKLLLEIDGEAIVSGEENESIMNITPGVKVKPWHDTPLEMGVGVRLPITDDKEFDLQTVFSVFYHF